MGCRAKPGTISVTGSPKHTSGKLLILVNGHGTTIQPGQPLQGACVQIRPKDTTH
jgi:hypothetical protein